MCSPYDLIERQGHVQHGGVVQADIERNCRSDSTYANPLPPEFVGQAAAKTQNQSFTKAAVENSILKGTGCKLACLEYRNAVVARAIQGLVNPVHSKAYMRGKYTWYILAASLASGKSPSKPCGKRSTKWDMGISLMTICWPNLAMNSREGRQQSARPVSSV